MLRLPPPERVDETRRGILTINDAGMLALLGIKHHRIEEFRITACGNLQIEIVGKDMPASIAPRPVTLICHAHSDGSRELSWDHKPDARWKLR